MKELLNHCIVRAQAVPGDVADVASDAAVVEPTFFQKYGNIAFIVAIFALMYFLMIRPQKKKQEAAQKMQGGLKAGDKVMTVNGAMGRISRVGDKTVWIKFGEIEIEYIRAAVAEVIKEDAEVK